jgi:hypothetical protein
VRTSFYLRNLIGVGLLHATNGCFEAHICTTRATGVGPSAARCGLEAGADQTRLSRASAYQPDIIAAICSWRRGGTHDNRLAFALEWRVPLRATAYSSNRGTHFDYGLPLSRVPANERQCVFVNRHVSEQWFRS